MSKITLTDLVNLENQTAAVNAINDNSAVLETAFENTLSRDGTAPNQMQAVLDMNNQRILNLPEPNSDLEPVRRIDIDDAVSIAGALSKFKNLSDLTDVVAARANLGIEAISVKNFGAVGDGITNDRAAIQAAVDAVIAAGGGKLLIPAGTYLTNGGSIDVDLSAITDRMKGRVIIEGDGVDTIITNTTGSCLRFINTELNLESFCEVNNLRLLGGSVSGSVGLTITKSAFMSLHGITIEGFDLGFQASDVDQIGIYDSTIRWNNKGGRINSAVTSTDPNSWTFVNVAIGNNATYGLEVDNANAFTFIGGTVQYNGVIGGPDSQFGILMTNIGTGYGNVLFSGMAFEGNGGAGDFLSAQTGTGTNHCNVTFDNVAFARTLNFVTVGYGTNNVNISGTRPKSNYKFINCNFYGFAGYTESASRPAIANTNPNATIDIDGVTTFWSKLEAPTSTSLYTGAAGMTTGRVVFGGSTSGSTTIQPANAASGTLTLPAATDTLVGKATTDTLTNKTITSPVITDPIIAKLSVGSNVAASLPTTLFTVSANTAQAPDPTNGAGEIWRANIVGADGEPPVLGIDSFSNFAVLDFRRANGTAAARTALGAGDIIQVIGSLGAYDSTHYSGGAAQIRSRAKANWSDTSQSTYYSFLTTPVGSPAVGGVKESVRFETLNATFTNQPRAVVIENMVAPASGTVGRFIGGDGDVATVSIENYGGVLSSFLGRSALGTGASPSAVTSGTILVNLGGAGYTNAGDFSGARGQLRFSATDNFTTTTQGTRASIFTTLSGSTTTSEGFAVENDGKLKAAKYTTAGLLQNDTSGNITTLAAGTGVATFLATPSSANLRAVLTDETGTGAAVFADTPTLVTPNIGAATGTSLATSGALTVGGASTLNGTVTANAAIQMANATPFMMKDSSGVAGNVLLLWTDNNLYMDNNAGGDYIFRTSPTNTERMRIKATTGNVSMASTTASISTATGALTVAGGVGVAGNLNVGQLGFFTFGVAGGSASNSLLTLASTSSGAPSGDSINITGSTINVTGALMLKPAASVTPVANGDLTFQATSNTSLTFKYKGSDGTVRTASLTLA